MNKIDCIASTYHNLLYKYILIQHKCICVFLQVAETLSIILCLIDPAGHFIALFIVKPSLYFV